jgi:hypothetical protein
MIALTPDAGCWTLETTIDLGRRINDSAIGSARAAR